MFIKYSLQNESENGMQFSCECSCFLAFDFRALKTSTTAIMGACCSSEEEESGIMENWGQWGKWEEFTCFSGFTCYSNPLYTRCYIDFFRGKAANR